MTLIPASTLNIGTLLNTCLVLFEMQYDPVVDGLRQIDGSADLPAAPAHTITRKALLLKVRFTRKDHNRFMHLLTYCC